MFDFKEAAIRKKLQDKLFEIDEKIEDITDFKLAINFQVTSPILPDFFVGKFRDDIIVYKRSSSLRIDFSLLPTESKEVKKQKSSLYYNPLNLDPKTMQEHLNLVLVNHQNSSFSTPLSKINLPQKRAILKEIFFKVGQEKKDSSSHTVGFHNMKIEKSHSNGSEK